MRATAIVRRAGALLTAGPRTAGSARCMSSQRPDRLQGFDAPTYAPHLPPRLLETPVCRSVAVLAAHVLYLCVQGVGRVHPPRQ